MYSSNMEFNTVDDVRRDIELKSQIKKAGQSAPENFKNLDQTVSNIFKSPGAGKLSDISYTAGFGNVYERGRDGNYYAKYENYLGAFGNEDRLGREQGAGEQLWNGFVKNLAKTGLYAIDGTVGTIVGLTKAISDGDMKSLWDNDFTDAMDYASKSLDRDLPNYYTDEQKSSNFFGKLFTANFLGNDFLNGLAFVGGAVLPQVILGTLTGGASLAVNTAKLGGKLAYSSAKRFGTSSLRNSLRVGTKVGKGTGELLNTGKFIAQSTFFEAGMEARHNFHDSIENWTTEYFNTYGKLPSSEEAEKYLSAAETGANSVFWGNVGVLSLTNASMFGKVFGLGKLTLPGTKTFNKMIGLGVESMEKGGLKAIAPTKLQKVLGNAYFIGRKPVSEGLVEEGSQGVITKMADTYTKAKYEGDDSYSFTQNLVDALGQQYGTKEGWNEIGVGMLVGAVGGNISGNFGIEGIIGKNSETFSKAVKGLQEKVDNRESQLETFRNLNRTNSMFNANIDNTQKEDGLESTQLYQDVVSNHSYIKANTPLKGYTDMTDDFDAVVDSLEITDDQLTDSGLESIDDYKTLMKDQFRIDLDSYKKANSFVRNLGLSNLKISKGNVVETEDALTLSFMMGEKSEEQARKIAGNIESLTGLTGVHSSLKFFETLNTTQLDNINKLKVQQDNLTKLENEIIKVQSSIEEQKALGADKTNITNLSKKYAVVSRQIDNLNNTIASTKETLNNDFDSIRASDATINEDFSNIDDVLEIVEKIRSFSKGLRKVGRDQDAKTLDNYVEQFSAFSQTSIDSKLTFDQMLNTNFFSSKGGGSLLKSITGEDYNFSKESIDSIRAIESQLVNKASQFGYAVGNTEEFLEQLRNNENLSEREKYKIESIARVLSAQTIVDERSKQLQDNFDNVVPEETIVTNDVEEITVTSPNIVGDTIQISNLVNINPTTSEQLKALVDEIASLTDQIVNKPTSYQLSELNKKRKQLENLNQELNSVRNQINSEAYADEIIPETQVSVGNESQISGETPQESQEEKINDIERRRLEELENLGKITGYTDNYKEPQTEFKIKKEYTLDSITEELVANDKIFIRDGHPSLKNIGITPRIESFYKKIGLTKLVESISGLKFIDTSKLKRGEAEKYYLNILNTLKPFLKNVSIYEVEDSIENALSGNGLAFADNENVYLGESAGKSLETLVHELLHTLTNRGLDSNYQNFYDESFANEISEIYKTAKEKIRGDYGLKNEQELIAEAFANPVFMAKLASIKTQNKNGKSSNLFSDLIESIRNFLNSFLKIDTTSNLLEDITNSVSTYLEKKEDIFSKEVIPLEEYIEEVTKINTKYDVELEQTQQEEKIDELVDDILDNPEQTDTEFAIKMLEEAIEYETSNEFGSTELANEYKIVLNNLKDGKINVNEIGDFLNKTTSREDTSSARIGSETIRTENGDIDQIPQTNQESLVKKEARIKEEIVGIEEEIYDLERPFKFSETSEYKEFKKLLSIPEEDRSEDQEVRINELRGNINDWILTMGTQTNGILFSDVVEQMVALDNITIVEAPKTVNITDAEVDENQNIVSLANRQNLKVALNFGAVTSTFKKNNTGEIFTEIANITISGLEDVSGVLLDGVEGVSLNPTTNAIQLSDEIVETINTVGKIHIPTSTENLTTYYNPVRQATATLSGDVNYNILKTDFYDEYEGEIIDDEDIYNLKQGQELFAYVDPSDPYNKSILYRLSSELGIMSESDIEATVENEIKLYKTIQLTNAQNKLRTLLNSPKKDQAKIKDQEELIQELLNSQKERIRKRLTGKRKTTISPDLASEIKSKLKIMLTNKDGDNVSVLKGSRTTEEIERLDASKLQTIRDIFADDVEFLTNLIESPSVELKSVGLKVDNVLPGFPNYFISKNNDGTLVREVRELSPQQIEKIHDIGFISNGKLETRIGSSNIDTTFVGRQLSEKNSSRVPVAIIKRGEKLIAYPLIVSSDLPTVTSEDMESIYNSELPETEKAIRLNELLARAGVNVQEVGNAFVVVGDQKINSDFFNQKVAQVENITYLRNVDNFLDGRIPKEEILRSGVSININLSEPFISPKIKLDFSNIVAKEVSNENLRSKSKKTVSSVMSQLAMDRQKVCK